MEDPEGNPDICRVCRCEAAGDRPLYHPCVCTGSIRYIHQECLLQWLKYSRKEYCELCKHRFSFTPIYSPDMPRRLPVKDIITGLLSSVLRAVRYWFHYTLVAFAWLGVVPLTACRIYRSLFTGSVSSLLTLPLDMLSTENLMSDCLQGCFVVTCTFCAFISLVWLREQILNGGAPDWLDNENQPANQQRNFLDLGIMHNLAGFGMGARVANQNNVPEGNVAAAAGGGGAGGGAEDQDEDGGDGAGNDGAQNAAQDDNWNPIEWDRAAEELTWERLLGLDGSLVFLEHVFWVVSLNTLFILVFAFFPYHIGHFTLIAVNANDAVSASHFEGLLTSLAGYLMIALSFISMYLICSLARLKKFQRLLGLCYMVVKVKLLVVIEIGLFPLVCGWWLDICSMSMFDATLKDRRNSFHLAPGTSMFIHWLVGMVYVFYFASFILLLREVLRPGVLWFLQNLNDPDFNPIHEMIHLPVYRHIRRFVASVIIFGSTVLLMLWLPIQVIRKMLPGFLPFNVILSSDAPVSELSLELLLLQVILPALLEQGHTRFWLKGLVSGWTAFVAWLLDLRSYLISDTPDNVRGQPDPPNVIPAHAPPQRPEILPPPPDPNAVHVPQGELAWPEPAVAAAEGEVAEATSLINSEINNATGIVEDQERYQNEAGQLSQQEQQQPAEAMNRFSWFHQTPQWNTEPDAIEQELNTDQPGAYLKEVVDELPAAQALYEQLPAPDEHLNRVANDSPDMMPEYVAPQDLPALELPALPAPPPAPLRGPPAAATFTYKRPKFFAIRIMLLLVLMSFTLFTVSLISLTLPVFLGRCIMSFWMGEARNHELYTAACGLYLCWLTLRIGTVLYNWIPQGSAVIFNKLHEWGILTLKSLMIAVLLVGVIPLQLGLIFEMVVIIPLRVPLDHTPVFFPWQDWALGILHAKMICGITMMGPQWWLKRILEQVYNDGLRNMNLAFILTHLCLPAIGVLGMALTVPYIIAESIVPAFGPTFEMQNLVQRRIYPFLLFVLMLVALADVQLRQFKRLYEHIKNDKYLVGQRLVNYNPHRASQENRIVLTPPT